MESNRKRCKVVMLPTDQADGLVIFKHPHNRLTAHKGPYTQEYLRHIDVESQHLYFTTDEEIKEGDWFIMDNNMNNPQIVFKHHETLSTEKDRKIIATTDYLTHEVSTNGGATSHKTELPQPSGRAFIEKYCKKGGIDEVDVEYITGFDNCNDPNYFCKLKVDPIHNTITIHPIKDNWSREEVKQAIIDWANYTRTRGKILGKPLDKWIKENL